MVFLHEICSNDSWRNEEPESVFLQKNNPQTLSSEHTRAATTLWGRILGRETADLDFTCQYSGRISPPSPQTAPHRPQPRKIRSACQWKPPNPGTAPDFPLVELFPNYLHICQLPNVAAVTTSSSNSKCLVCLGSLTDSDQVPTSTHKNVFQHHFYNTRVKAVTAIPTGNLNFSGIHSTVVWVCCGLNTT